MLTRTTRMLAGLLFLIGIAAMAQSPTPSPSPAPPPVTPDSARIDRENATTSQTIARTTTPDNEAVPEEIEVSSPSETKTIDAAPGSQLGWQPIAVSYITGLQVILVPMIVALIKSKLDRLPREVIPIVAVVIGITSDLLATLIAGGGFDLFRGSLVGVLGMILRKLSNVYVLDRMRA